MDNVIRFEFASSGNAGGGGSAGSGASSRPGNMGFDFDYERRSPNQLRILDMMREERKRHVFNMEYENARYGRGVAAVRQVGRGVQTVAQTASMFGMPTGGMGVMGGRLAAAGGPAGIAVAIGAAIAQGAKQAYDSIHLNANRFASTAGMYSPQVAAASGLAQVEKIQGDIRRSKLLGPELAAFVTAQNRLEQAKEDLRTRRRITSRFTGAVSARLGS
ncbi:MAG: hypothetical protein JNM56_02940 [Planctomycetia bacterium]|nr:hypothetical protein [Planctomycetia bacterium]